MSLTQHLPALPTEVLNMVLGAVDDSALLWIVCRQVSRAVHREIEFLFQTTRLKTTELQWIRFRSTFSRLSADGQTAFFTTRSVTDRRHIPWCDV